MSDLTPFADLVPLNCGLYVVSTLRGNGGIQSSVVDVGVQAHPVTGGQVVHTDPETT